MTGRRELRRNSSFRLLFTAQFTSNIGTWFANVAVIGAILDATGGSALAGLASSLVFVATSFPQFVLMPLTGTVADRVNRRRLIVAGSLVQAMLSLSFCLIGGSRWWLGIVAQLGISTIASFVHPAVSAAMPNLVRPDDVPKASALLSSTFGVTLALGSMFGGVFAASFGRTASFVANAVSFVLVAGLVSAIRRDFQAGERPRGRVRPLADTRAAIAFGRSQPFIMSLYGSRLAFGITIGAVGVLPLMSTDVFGAGDTGTGFLLAARGIGFLLGPLTVTHVVGRGARAVVVAIAVGLVTFGVGYGAVALAPSLALACAGVFVAHLGGGTISTVGSAALQLVAPDELRGRIVATDRALASMSQTVSYPVVGLVAGWFGPSVAVLLSAVTSVLVGGVFLSTRLRGRTAYPPLLAPPRAVSVTTADVARPAPGGGAALGGLAAVQPVVRRRSAE